MLRVVAALKAGGPRGAMLTAIRARPSSSLSVCALSAAPPLIVAVASSPRSRRSKKAASGTSPALSSPAVPSTASGLPTPTLGGSPPASRRRSDTPRASVREGSALASSRERAIARGVSAGASKLLHTMCNGEKAEQRSLWSCEAPEGHAPLARSISTAASWLAWHATCNAVAPSMAGPSVFAPEERSHAMSPSKPSCAAR
eukprot:scaffold169930_cov28-Tisochrysis_lutea.AAC.5